MLHVTAPLADGGLLEFDVPEATVARLQELRAAGFAGTELINRLLTDDWGPPPTSVRITGTLADGTRVDETIAYQ